MAVTRQTGVCAHGHVALTHYLPGEASRAHRHHHAQISLVLSGGYSEQGTAGRVVAGAGAFTGKPAGFEHETTIGDLGALILSINLDEAPFLTDYFGSRQTTDLRDPLVLEAAAGTLEAHVRPHMGLLALIEDRPPTAPWVDGAQARPGSGDGFRSTRGAEALGVHRVTYARMFRRAFGLSPSAARQSGRMACAVNEIIRTERKLNEVALDTGFSDQAHMTRQIRSVTGLPPARLRRLFTGVR
jgi:AraC-like DNA-binding protein